MNDVENSKYILNFGSNAFEAHQGHIPFATRIQNGRFKNGAKLVTFDVRLSNTAGGSDEWFAPFPGTDGAIEDVEEAVKVAAKKGLLVDLALIGPNGDRTPGTPSNFSFRSSGILKVSVTASGVSFLTFFTGNG